MDKIISLFDEFIMKAVTMNESMLESDYSETTKIEDFTQNYKANEFRIVVRKKIKGQYFDGLRKFLLRYYTNDRALIELEKAKNYSVKANETPIITEIYKCLAYRC